MDKTLIGMCGVYCGSCGCRETEACAGCQANKGVLFWGTCVVATCCMEKGLTHCGLCQDLPCDALQEMFDHPTHGDNGEKLANLRAWARGEETFIKIGEFGPKGRS
jgi:hypothetical protein